MSTMSNTKPKLEYFDNGKWCCRLPHSQPFSWAVGIGLTPLAAYQSWQKNLQRLSVPLQEDNCKATWGRLEYRYYEPQQPACQEFGTALVQLHADELDQRFSDLATGSISGTHLQPPPNLV